MYIGMILPSKSNYFHDLTNLWALKVDVPRQENRQYLNKSGWGNEATEDTFVGKRDDRPI